nr:cytochrome P450 [Bradyrhizobium brasilense]
MGEFIGFSGELFNERRANPSHDIATLLAKADIDGEPAKLRDFIGNLILVLVGGNETTRNSLSHTVVTLSRNPMIWDRIKADTSLLQKGTAEMVRHASPVLHMRRTATEDTELGGRKIKKGDKVVVWYVSGNRDESVYDNPDAFDLARKGPLHVGFGAGQHVCVGSRLAEMQLRVALGLLAERVDRFELKSEPRRFRSNFLNGLKNLNVVLHPL